MLAPGGDDRVPKGGETKQTEDKQAENEGSEGIERKRERWIKEVGRMNVDRTERTADGGLGARWTEHK